MTDALETQDARHATDDADPNTTTDTKLRTITAREKRHEEGAARRRIRRQMWTNTTVPPPFHDSGFNEDVRAVRDAAATAAFMHFMVFSLLSFLFSVFLYPISHEDMAKAWDTKRRRYFCSSPQMKMHVKGLFFLGCKDVYSKQHTKSKN